MKNIEVNIYLCASGFPVFYILLFCSETRPANENHNSNKKYKRSMQHFLTIWFLHCVLFVDTGIRESTSSHERKMFLVFFKNCLHKCRIIVFFKNGWIPKLCVQKTFCNSSLEGVKINFQNI